MFLNDVFESFGRIFDFLVHGVPDISESDNIRVCLILFVSLRRTLFRIKSRLIEVNVFAHCYSLSRDEQLQQS